MSAVCSLTLCHVNTTPPHVNPIIMCKPIDTVHSLACVDGCSVAVHCFVWVVIYFVLVYPRYFGLIKSNKKTQKMLQPIQRKRRDSNTVRCIMSKCSRSKPKAHARCASGKGVHQRDRNTDENTECRHPIAAFPRRIVSYSLFWGDKSGVAGYRSALGSSTVFYNIADVFAALIIKFTLQPYIQHFKICPMLQNQGHHHTLGELQYGLWHAVQVASAAGWGLHVYHNGTVERVLSRFRASVPSQSVVIGSLFLLFLPIQSVCVFLHSDGGLF